MGNLRSHLALEKKVLFSARIIEERKLRRAEAINARLLSDEGGRAKGT